MIYCKSVMVGTKTNINWRKLTSEKQINAEEVTVDRRVIEMCQWIGF